MNKDKSSSRYAGYYYDIDMNHYYLNARYYNPENGNFLSLDAYPG
ncbi:RHS repeat-associated core domain-containing protein, partial [Peribacillus sp. NPDC096540]